MKKIVSGISFMIVGLAGMLTPIVAAIPLTVDMAGLTGWYGSRLWYILFSPDYLNLKAFFGVCLFVFAAGFVLTLIDCFTDKQR